MGGTALAAEAKNLALPANGGTITASGTEVSDGRWTVAMGADGDKTTRWSSNAADNAWIQAQLANPTRVDHVNIYWERACSPTFRIDVSNDGTAWTHATDTLQADCPTTTVANDTPQKITFKTDVASQTWKYVRMQGMGRVPFGGIKYGMSLFEFEVWDGPEPAPVVPGIDKPALIPLPVNVAWGEGEGFALSHDTKIVAQGEKAREVADLLAAELRASTGADLEVADSATGTGHITLKVAADANTGGLTGDEAYGLTVAKAGVTIEARNRHGLWNGTRTLKQLFPAAVYSRTLVYTDWVAPAVTITDAPRFAYRSAMLDPARSFVTPAEVKKVIDSMADVKMSYLHLHLADDQGWRIEITNEGRVEGDTIDYTLLTKVSGRTAMAGHRFDNGSIINYQDEIGRTGFYTQAEYRDLVKYAKDRGITIVPEIDAPGHMQAALHAIPQLNTEGSSFNGGGTVTDAQHSTGDVGNSYLDPNSEHTWRFLTHVFTQLAAMTDGPIMHMGGDEPHKMAQRFGHPVYAATVLRIVNIVKSTGKKAMGWNEIAEADLGDGDVVQYWYGSTTHTTKAVQAGAKVVVSKSNAAYLDMKYTPETPIGLTWSGTGDFDKYYNWDPAVTVPGVGEAGVIGVEGPMWSETFRGGRNVEFMLMPRATSHAEIGWTPQAKRDLPGFRARMAAHMQRLTYGDQNYYDGPKAAWQYSAAGVPTVAKPGEGRTLTVGVVAAPGTVLDNNGIRKANSSDPGGATVAAVNGKLTYTINFGDNTPEVAATVTTKMPRNVTFGSGLYELSAEHTYATAGTYLVTIKGSDGSTVQSAVKVAADVQVPVVKAPIVRCGAEVVMELDATEVKPDAWPRVTASGFMSDSLVTVKIGDKVIGKLMTNEDGDLSRTFPIELNTYGGNHTITLEQVDSTGAKCTATAPLKVISDRLPLENPIDLTKLPASAITADSEENSASEVALARYAVDGNAATFWHSRWSGGNVPGHPHWIALDLGKTYDLTGVSLRARAGNANGRIKDFKFQVSTNGRDWVDHVSLQGPNNAGENIFQCVSTAQNCTTFPKVAARYVRVLATNSWNNDQFTTLGELRLGGVEKATEPTATPAPSATPAPTNPAPSSTPAPSATPAPSSTPAPSTTPAPSSTPAPSTPSVPGNVERIAGADRVSTALEMYKAGEFESTDVVLASALGFADGLAATPLADALNAPVLLTNPGKLDPAVLAELKANGVKRVVVVGGVNSVKPSVVAELKAAGIDTLRLAGSSRFDTAAAVTGHISELKGGLDKLFLVDGNEFADALAVGAVAFRNGGALLLTDGATLPKATVTYLSNSSAEVVAVGGKAATAVKRSTVVGPVFQQVIGGDRYETATKVAQMFGANAKLIGVASGAVYADSLAAGAYVAQKDGVLVLTLRSALPKSTSAYIGSVDGAKVVIAGGTASVTQSVQRALEALVK
ncbi:family 20 glycosylhydrolase [Buchananella felis]|uniref:family 20 glycosylhydrolase n=1 Tax=Buchananella felis TaxID=3231492 RepID=UPI003527B793